MNASALVALLCAVGATGQSAPDQRPSSTTRTPAARPAAATVPTAAAPAAGAVAHGAGRSQQLALDAVQLLADSLAPKADDELVGDPMSLTQALGSAIDPRSRPAVIRAYWNLAAATADYHNRRTEAHFLAQLQAERGDLAPPSEPAGADHYQEAAPPADQAESSAELSAEAGAPAADSTDVGEVAPESAPLQDGPPVGDDPAAATESEPRFSAPSGEAEAAGRHEWKYRAAPANSALDEPDRAQLAAALSTSRARIQEALVAAVEAQHQLAQLVRGNRPALASDAPHVGPYRTEFRAVFAGRAAPSEAWRLDRTLPLRQRELLTRTAAVIACEDALDARLDAYRRGECPLAEVLEALDLLVAERQGFVAAVRRYNDDIGDYAMLIAPAGASEVSLAALLIKPRTARITPGHTAPSRAPAGAATPAEVAVPEARPGALAGDGVGAASFNAPSQRRGAAPSRPHAEPDASAATSAPAAAGESSRQPNRSRSNARRGGSSAAPPPAKTSDVPSTDELQFDGPPDVSIEPAPPTETQPNNSHSTYRAGTSASAAGARRAAPAELAAVLSNTRLYGDVTSEPPHRQAQQLVARLAASADRAIERIEGAESPSVAPLTIEQCLTAASAARPGTNPNLTQRRRSAVVSYWNCRQQASCVGVCEERSQLLAALGSLVLSRRGAAEGAADALCWRAHSLAAQAQCEQAVTELFVAEWRLNLELSQPLDRPWYLAGTPPHAGRYRTKLDELAPVLAESTAVRQRAAMIGQSYGAVTARAAEVVEIDGLRSDLLAQYAAGRSSLTEVLRLLERQCRDSQAFLADLTRYNLAIADYALSVVPTDLPITTLAGALVMSRDTQAGG